MISLLKPQWAWWSALRTNRAAAHICDTQRQNTIFRCWVWFLNIWEEDVMYTWLPIHDTSSTCEVTISDILCVLWGLLLALIYNIYRENHPRWALYFHFSIFLLVSESERGNLHYDKVAISRDLLAQSDLVTGPCIMYEQPAPAKYQGPGGGGGGFLQQIFVCV